MSITLPTDSVSTKFSTIGSLVGGSGGLLAYVYIIAGLCMLVVLIRGGIILMTAAGNPKKSAEGYGDITAAIIGFAIIFLSYIIAQIVQVMLGVKFL